MDQWKQFLKLPHITRPKIILNMRPVFLSIFSLLFFSCAKLNYLWEQAPTQLKIHFNAIDNNQVLQDPNISSEVKRKIELIREYKKFFFNYFNEKETAIYNKSYFLKNEAVSYLVIFSPKNEVKAMEECFPFMGCFPYIGFFELDSAKKFQKEKEDELFDTYIRPVYAYSTLNYFTDPILSSFFYYDDVNLAEVIFHELFHTMFFIKNDVGFNENLATFFSKELINIYFKDKNNKLLENYFEQNRDYDLINNEIKKNITLLNINYKEKKSGESDGEILNNFLTNRFLPSIKEFCKINTISNDNCFPLNRKWNNAVFAALATYESDQNEIKHKFDKLNLPLKDFYLKLKDSYKEFKTIDEPNESKFSEYYLKSI